MNIVTILFYLLLLVLPLGNLTRLPFGNVALTINDFLLPVLIFAWVFFAIAKKKTIYLPPRFSLVVLFVMWALITLIHGWQFIGLAELVISALYWGRWVMYAGLFLIVYNLIRWSPVPEQFIRTVLGILFIGQVFFLIVGFVQFVLFPDFSRFVPHGWDPHYYRLLSTFLDPNFAGIFLILGITVFGSLLFFKKQSIGPSIIGMGVFIALACIGVVLTFSRSTYLAFIVALGLLGLLKSRILLIVLIVLAILSFAFIPRVQTRIIGAFEVDETVQLRLRVYENTVEIIRENPWFGVGFNAFRYAQDRAGYFRNERGINYSGGHAGAGSDSSLLFLLATTGIPGFLIYLAVWGVFVLDSFAFFIKKQYRPEVRALGLAVFISLLSLMVHTQFVHSLFLIWIMEWLWVVVGVMYGMEKVKVKS